MTPTNFPIVHHHVGARGNVPLPLDLESPIRGDLSLIYYDADADAITDDLQRRLRARSVKLLPYCIAGAEGTQDFYLTESGFGSSLFPVNERYNDFASVDTYGELTVEEGHVLSRVVPVEVTTLDAVCQTGADVPSPDFLSIDAEGAELDILEGASRTLRADVLWVKTEAWIHEVYKGARTFPETLAYLHSMGFDLVQMEPYGPHAPKKVPLGAHGDGYVLGVEATFARRIDTIIPDGAEPTEEIAVKLYKLAAIALLNSQLALARLCLDRVRGAPFNFFADEQGKTPARYLELLREFDTTYSEFERGGMYLPEATETIHRWRGYGEAIKRATPERAAEIRAALNAEKRAITRTWQPIVERAQRFYWGEVSKLEMLLGRYGLRDQATVVRDNRKKHCETVIKSYFRFTQQSI